MLKRQLKAALFFIYNLTGIPFLIRELLGRKRVTILVYHRPAPEVFELHIRYLSEHYNFTSLDNLVSAINSKNWHHIPPKSLVVTFDDGHVSNYLLTEIFAAYKVQPTIFLCSHIVDTQRSFWFLPDQFKTDQTGLLQTSVASKTQKRQALNLVEIVAMSSEVLFGSHTRLHVDLPVVADEESYFEISDSKSYLEAMLNKPVQHFAFPRNLFTEREINHVKQSGYRSARTVACGFNSIKTNPFRLRAFCVDDNASIPQLKAQITWLYPFLKYLFQGDWQRLHSPF